MSNIIKSDRELNERMSLFHNDPIRHELINQKVKIAEVADIELHQIGVNMVRVTKEPFATQIRKIDEMLRDYEESKYPDLFEKPLE